MTNAEYLNKICDALDSLRKAADALRQILKEHDEDDIGQAEDFVRNRLVEAENSVRVLNRLREATDEKFGV